MKRTNTLQNTFLLFILLLTFSRTFAQTVTTFAGDGSIGSTDGNAATFNYPTGIDVDAAGNLFVCDYSGHKIRKITTAGVVSTFAGSGTQGSTNGTGINATFWNPIDIALDASGNLFVCDFSSNKIRKITPAGVVTTFAGSGSAGFTNATGIAASFRFPNGIAIDTDGNLYVADRNNHSIRKITSAGVVSTLAGTGTQGYVDGQGDTAKFNSPSGIAVDASGNVYVADESHRIRKITPSGFVSTIAGIGSPSFTNGTSTVAAFKYPNDLEIDNAGNIYVCDKSNHAIRKVDINGNVTTIAGSGNSGFANGTGTNASFKFPDGITIDSDGNIFVADHQNQRIRKITISTTTELSQKIISQPLQLYPNPVLNFLKIEDRNNNAEYEIYDFSGRLILEGKLTSSEDKMNVESLVPGYFIIKVTTPIGVKIGKFIKA